MLVSATALDLGRPYEPEVGYDVESHPMIISVTYARQGRVACVCIAGDVDLLDPVDVGLAQRQLADVTCETLFVDLAGVTFGGAALVHFLYALSARVPGAAVSLCGAPGITKQIIKLAGLDQMAVVRDDLPKDWATGTAWTSIPEKCLPAGHPALARPAGYLTGRDVLPWYAEG